MGMRSELGQALREELGDQHGPSYLFSVPVFLDSEDLYDLDDLQSRVRKSHNLVLLLTKDVLLRPWVLVEIVTAVEAKVRVLLVEVNKRTAERFGFPDDSFY